MEQKIKLDVSGWTVIKIIAILLGLYAAFMIRDVIALFFIVLILVATFSPLVDIWSKKISRPGAVIAILLIILAVITAIIWLIIPPFVSQTVQLIQSAPEFFNRFDFLHDHIPQIKQSISSITSQAGNFSDSLISFTSSLFGGIVAIITIIVLFVYLLLDEKAMKKSLISLFPSVNQDEATDLFKKIARKAGNWFRGQLFLGVIIGVIDLIGLLIIGVPYALTLAVTAGVMEIIPTIGPIISGVLAAIIALSVSPIKAIFVVALFIIVQQLENTIIVPKVMQKAVGLPPVVIIFAILIGAKLYGFLGVVLAVPITACLMVVIQEYSTVKKLFSSYE